MKFKRFFAAVSAAVMLGSCSLSSVSAEVQETTEAQKYHPYDLNQDKVVNIADAVYINGYLKGQYEPEDLTALDINQNGLISGMDISYIQFYIAGV